MNKLALCLAAMLLAACAAPRIVTPAAPDTPPPSVTSAPSLTPVATLTPAPTASLVPSATLAPTQAPTPTPAQIGDVIAYEMRGAFDFFWEQANTDVDSPGYGLIRDRYPGSEGIASIASVGFGLTAYLIGIDKGYITFAQGQERVSRTLDTLLSLERTEGFYYHFVDQHTGKRAWESEVSSIDTAILLMGVLSAGEYFGGEIEAKAVALYDEVNWPWFVDESRQMFYMAYRPESGFSGHWDFYAEQLMLYVLAAGSDTHPVDETTYYTFTRHRSKFGTGQRFIHSWFGSLFTYQFSHAWIDFREYTDRDGVNWFDNSVEASLAHVNFALSVEDEYETIGAAAWGLTASDGPDGYNGLYGAPPSGFDNQAHVVDDTVPPAGAIGSIIFVPEPAQAAMLNYYALDRLNGPYGFQDAYNLSRDWFAPDVIGIDKGISLLMLANYENDQVYVYTMTQANIVQGLARLHFTRTP